MSSRSTCSVDRELSNTGNTCPLQQHLYFNETLIFPITLQHPLFFRYLRCNISLFLSYLLFSETDSCPQHLPFLTRYIIHLLRPTLPFFRKIFAVSYTPALSYNTCCALQTHCISQKKNSLHSRPISQHLLYSIYLLSLSTPACDGAPSVSYKMNLSQHTEMYRNTRHLQEEGWHGFSPVWHQNMAWENSRPPPGSRRWRRRRAGVPRAVLADPGATSCCWGAAEAADVGSELCLLQLATMTQDVWSCPEGGVPPLKHRRVLSNFYFHFSNFIQL